MRASSTGVPVLVTEHGFADEKDRLRPRARRVAAHLGRAIAGGARVLGYLHWSLMDNFEWADGYAPRFGLYRVPFDRDPSARERTHSAELYAKIAKENAITREVAESVGLLPAD